MTSEISSIENEILFCETKRYILCKECSFFETPKKRLEKQNMAASEKSVIPR